jgi:hypothetical protein
MSKDHKAPGLLDPSILLPAMRDAFVKLDPRKLLRNPVIFVTEVVAAVVTILFIRDLASNQGGSGFSGQIAAWLWFTVLFATFAEAVAEGRGRAQAGSLKKTTSELVACRLGSNGKRETIPASSLRVGDVVLIAAGELIPGDGEVIEGIASVNESAITGESAPVIRESGGDRSAVTGGTQVLSDEIKVRITVEPGSSFVDRMIALIEGAQRDRSVDPAVGTDADLPVCLRRDLGPGRLFRHRALSHGSRRPPRHADPDHDRRAAVGYWHCRHGPPGALQRDRHLGPRRGGGWRRRYLAPRQDRHDHLWQPDGE